MEAAEGVGGAGIGGTAGLEGFGQALGDFGDLGGPTLEVFAVAAVFDDAAVEEGAILLHLLGEAEIEGFLDGAGFAGGGGEGAFLVAVEAGGEGDGGRLGGVVAVDGGDGVDGPVLRLVEAEFVDDGLEAVVVGAEGVEDGPDDAEGVGVVELGLGVFVRGDDDGDDDVAVALAWGGAHDAADGLDDVDLRVALGEEEDGVEGGDVDALGEAANVGEEVAGAVAAVGLEPGEGVVARQGAHLAVDVAGLDAQGGVEARVGGELLEERGGGLGGLDGAAEGDGAAGGHAVGGGEEGGVGEALGEGVDAAQELDGGGAAVVAAAFEGLALLVGELFVGGVLGEFALGEGEDEHLVIGQAAFGDGLPEADAVDFLAVEGRVVHGAELDGAFLCLLLGALGVEARGGGHVETAADEDVGVVVDIGEGGFLLFLGDGAGGAVGLVADGEVEGEGVAPQFPLGFFDDGDGLVGGEDDGEGVGELLAEVADALGEKVGAGGGRQGQGVGVFLGGVLAAFGALVGLGVGADADGVEGIGGVVAPGHEGLVEEGDGGHKEEDEAFAAGLLLDQAQGGEGLAGAAGHDEFAAVVRGIVCGGGLEGLLLVVAEGLGGDGGAGGVARQYGPIGLEGAQPREGHHLHGDGAVGKRPFGVVAPSIGGGEDKAVGEGALGTLEGKVFAERGQEGVDVGLGNDVAVFVAFGLDAIERAVDVLGHQVNARVLAKVELRPKPDAGELRLIERQAREQAFHQMLETLPQRGFVPLRLLAEARQHLIQRHAHGRSPPRPGPRPQKRRASSSRTSLRPWNCPT